MPKEGFTAITIPEDLDLRISKFTQEHPEIAANKTQAILQSWQFYEKNKLEEKKPKAIKIGDKYVGHDELVFFIAEIGINHNGDVALCKKMIDIAVREGCDAVKFQKKTPDLCVPEDQKNKPKETPWGDMTYLEYKKRMEFGEKEYREIDEHCKKQGIIWFASPWDLPSVDFLEKFNVPCYKIASASITDEDLLRKVKSTGKPVILSTGMSTMEEVTKAINLLGEENLILMHCVSTYPAKDKDLNINVIKTFRKTFNCPIGYSGHEPGFWGTIAASVLGACIIEKHFTLDKAMWGTDQAASLDPSTIGTACRVTKRARGILGGYEKKVQESEIPIREKLRKA